MSDFIRREDVLDAIQKREDEVDSVYSAFWEGLKIAQDIVEKVPSVESERKNGKWNFIGDNMFKCTCCGVLYTTHQLNGLRNYETDPYAPYFCPNCGADLRGENERPY